jgi:hypothetical protein
VDEARTILRSLLGQIVLKPTPEGLKAELKGNIRGLIAFDDQTPVFLRMVAGEGFCCYRQSECYWPKSLKPYRAAPTSRAATRGGGGTSFRWNRRAVKSGSGAAGASASSSGSCGVPTVVARYLTDLHATLNTDVERRGRCLPDYWVR